MISTAAVGDKYREPERRLRRRLFRYSFVLVLVLCTTVGLFLVQRDSSLSWEARLSGVGTGLLASTAFALVFYLLADRERDGLLLHRMQESLSDHKQSMINQWTRDQLLYMPVRHYPPTGSFDPAFNADLMAGISDSSTYYFQGVSAKYVAARLRAARHCPGSVVVIVPHPKSSAIRRRVADRLKNPKYAGRTPEQLDDETQREMLESLVGLFDCRHLTTVVVVFAQETAVTRTELTDHGMFLTWYHGAESRGRPFPETLRFGPGSFYYQVAKLDIIRTSELADEKNVLRFTYQTKDREARAAIASLFELPTAKISVPALREAYATRMRSFHEFLQELRG